MAQTNLALYPGSFDPVTFGHLNLVSRGLKLFDRVLVGVACNVRKAALFSATERVEMVARSFRDNPRVEVDTIDGLLVKYAEQKHVSCIMRGLRAVSDFEYEFQLAHLNRRLGGGLETVFMMTGEEHFYVSSNMVREVASFGGSVTGLVPPHVAAALQQKFTVPAP